ncbi:MAG: branched-chain amino acid transport system II carrier protein [Deltaproteobacteria bacterium]|jgi:LIVCS family branched-chain amino acid:cation transporter|nr:branched-chain amino acid transport system II carrier protein [Deltaproteobacteria bacterium]
MNKQHNVVYDSVIVGLALFAMLFGAGNIIFPPYIGVIAGDSWFLGFIAYFFADIGLAVMAFCSLLTSRTIDRFESTFYRLGYWPARIMCGGIILSVGYIAGPRTCTVSYELGVAPIIGDTPYGLPVYSALYFIAAWLFCVRESKMIDMIGKFLTPLLVIGLIGLIIVGMANPVGEMIPAREPNVWYMGLISGYQTLDACTAVVFGFIVSKDLANKGYATPESKVKAVVCSSFLMAFLMLIVYGGLCYVGATAASVYDTNVQHGYLVVSLFQSILGFGGSVFLGIVVLLACLSTGAALAGAPATYFTRLTNGKLKYNVIVTLVCFSYALVSNIGLANILAFAVPILLIIFPPYLLMAVLGLFAKRIRNDNIYKIGTGFTIIYAILDVARMNGVEAANVINVLPLSEHGFGWLLLAMLGCIMGYFIKPKGERLPD